jgi:glycosyltransferase involved in cell wall biosynthesis
MRLLLFNLATDLDDPILGFTTGWIRALAKRVESIHVITMRTGRVNVPENVRVYSVGKEKGYSEPRRVMHFYRLLLLVLREVPIDVCFSHMIPVFTVLAAPVLKARHIPIVTWYAHRQVTCILKLAHFFSDHMVSIDQSSYPYRHEKFLPLGHGIEVNLFSPKDTAPASHPHLLFVGRLSPIKDPITLIEAVHLLRQRGHKVDCILVGEAPVRDRAYATRVRQRVRELELEGIAQFAGGMTNDQVVHWYHRCFAHVNCSPADHSLDKTALEAMACGRLSLSSTLGFRQTMGPWADCLLFRHGDASDLAEKLSALLALPQREVIQMGFELRQSVLQMHTLERVADQMVGLFLEVGQHHAER